MEAKSIKLVVIGDGAVGKTCLLISYSKKEFPTKYIPTVFDNYVVTLTAGNENVELGLWDTAGQEEYDRLRHLSYANANVFLLCFSVISQVSYHNITAKWYPELVASCPQVPFVLVGTKTDVRKNPEEVIKLREQGQGIVTTEQGNELAKRLKAVKYIECSALTRENLKDVFDEAVKAVLVTSRRRQKKNCIIM